MKPSITAWLPRARSILSANVILGVLSCALLFFMIRVFIDYLYYPTFGELEAVAHPEVSIDPLLLNRIQQKIEEGRQAQESDKDAQFPDPFY